MRQTVSRVQGTNEVARERIHTCNITRKYGIASTELLPTTSRHSVRSKFTVPPCVLAFDHLTHCFLHRCPTTIYNCLKNLVPSNCTYLAIYL